MIAHVAYVYVLSHAILLVPQYDFQTSGVSLQRMSWISETNIFMPRWWEVLRKASSAVNSRWFSWKPCVASDVEVT